jgi:hypothetical protein
MFHNMSYANQTIRTQAGDGAAIRLRDQPSPEQIDAMISAMTQSE